MVEALGPNSHDGMPNNIEGDFGSDHQQMELEYRTRRIYSSNNVTERNMVREQNTTNKNCSILCLCTINCFTANLSPRKNKIIKVNSTFLFQQFRNDGIRMQLVCGSVSIPFARKLIYFYVTMFIIYSI